MFRIQREGDFMELSLGLFARRRNGKGRMVNRVQEKKKKKNAFKWCLPVYWEPKSSIQRNLATRCSTKLFLQPGGCDETCQQGKRVANYMYTWRRNKHAIFELA